MWGGNPSATQRQLIERVAQLTLRVGRYGSQICWKLVPKTLHDTNQYLAWSNSLGRALRDLGMKAATPKPKDLAAYLESRAAA